MPETQIAEKTTRRVYKVDGRVWWLVHTNDHRVWVGPTARKVDRINGSDRVTYRPDQGEQGTTVHLSPKDFADLVARDMSGRLYGCGWCSHTSARDWTFCPSCGRQRFCDQLMF